MIRMLAISLATMFALSACQTMQGLGKDIEAGGKKLEEATKKKSSSSSTQKQ